MTEEILLLAELHYNFHRGSIVAKAAFSMKTIAL